MNYILEESPDTTMSLLYIIFYNIFKNDRTETIVIAITKICNNIQTDKHRLCSIHS